MPLVISDEFLKAAGMDEREAKIEIACRLFDAGKLSLGHASKMAGMTENELESELQIRELPRHRYTEDMLEKDVETLKKLGRW